MSGSTTNYGFKYAEAADEVNKFPVNVDEPKTKEIDKVIFEHTLTYKARSGAFNLVSGEFAEQTKAGESTFTLPAVGTASQIIGAFAGEGATAKITTSGGAKIYGDFIKAEATITLKELQHVILFSNGVSWFIIAGEPKREAEYLALKTFTKAEMEAGVTISTTRDAFVTLTGEAGHTAILTVGGKPAGFVPEGATASTSFMVPAGQVLKGGIKTEVYTLLR